MRRTARCAAWMVAMGWLLMVGNACAQDTTTALKPYTARYSVKYRGLSGGEIEFKLRSQGNGRHVFTSHLLPNFLGSLFASDQAEDSSEFLLTNNTIMPQHFRSEDGTAKTDKDIDLVFDWNKRLVSGRAEDKNVELALTDGAQERLSIQLAASIALQQGRDPGVLTMIERDEIQQFKISRQGTEHINTAAGQFDATVLRSERVGGSSRSTRYWYVEQLGYIPARAERSSKGKVDIVMELKSFHRDE